MEMNSTVDTTVKIFDELYLCKIPNYSSMSVDYLKIFGTPTTFDRDIDNELSKEWIKVMIPISQMVDYFKEGVLVRIIYEKDTLAIYEAIVTHIRKWKEVMTYGLNTRNAPIDDLIILDQFAQAVYPYATAHFDSSLTKGYLKTPINSSLANANRLMDRMKRGLNDENKEPEPELEQVSLGNFLKSKKMGGKSWQ